MSEKEEESAIPENVVDMFKYKENREKMLALKKEQDLEELTEVMKEAAKTVYTCTVCDSADFVIGSRGDVACSKCDHLADNLAVANSEQSESYKRFKDQRDALATNACNEIMQTLSSLSILISDAGANWIQGIEISGLVLTKTAETIPEEERFKFLLKFNNVTIPWALVEKLSFVACEYNVWPKSRPDDDFACPNDYCEFYESLVMAKLHEQFHMRLVALHLKPGYTQNIIQEKAPEPPEQG